MSKQHNEVKTKIIQETFNDKRKMKCIENKDELGLDEHVYKGGDIFITDDGQFVGLDFQQTDFDEHELVKHIELAENLYEKHEKFVNLYLICPKNVNVCVRECEIRSDASFAIKLACIQEDLCEITLNRIKEKIKRNEMLTSQDLKDLGELPVKCRKEDRNYYRTEYLKIINRYHY